MTFPEWNSRRRWIQTGSESGAWMKALLKLMLPVFKDNVSDSTRNNRTVPQATRTGAKVSWTVSWRSPRTQYRASFLLLVPSGVRLRRKNPKIQVPGKT
jgi:hypothetical protein